MIQRLSLNSQCFGGSAEMYFKPPDEQRGWSGFICQRNSNLLTLTVAWSAPFSFNTFNGFPFSHIPPSLTPLPLLVMEIGFP